ncbi:hypothetical protein V8E36_000886 [Tilletia maclaganii]
MTVTSITNLIEFKAALKDHDVVLVEFCAPGCDACRVIAPFFDKLSEQYGNQVKFSRVDVKEAADVFQEVGITAVPSFHLYVEGIDVAEVRGAIPGALEELARAAVHET